MNNNRSAKRRGANKTRQTRKIVVSRNVNVTFPPKVKVLQKYSTVVNFSHATSTEQNYRFRGNGLSTISETAGSGQPWGYDQWSLMYERYLVDRVSMEVKFVNSSSVPFEVLLNYQVDANYANIDGIASQPYVVLDTLGSNTGINTTTLRLSANAKDVLGIPALHEGLDEYTGVTGDPGGNPARVFYGSVYVRTLTGVAIGTSAVQAVVTFTFSTTYFRRKDVGPS